MTKGCYLLANILYKDLPFILYLAFKAAITWLV